MATDIQISIVGSAGDGTIAAGEILRNALAGMGYKVISFDVYPPEIRGFGKCIARMRITTEQAYSLKHKSDVMVSLDDSHAIPHANEVRDCGAVIYEQGSIVRLPEGGHMSAHVGPGQLPYPLPIRELSEKSTGANRSRNIVVLGFIAGLFNLPAEGFRKAIGKKFRNKAAAAEASEAAFKAGLDYAAKTFKLDDVSFGPPVSSVVAGATVEMINGNAAIARGALDAGIDTFFGYPITPATSIMERLANEMPKRGGRLLQTEDEISAISAVVGAGFTGARAATSTSGPGLSLMAEMLGMGVIGEVPAVPGCARGRLGCGLRFGALRCRGRRLRLSALLQQRCKALLFLRRPVGLWRVAVRADGFAGRRAGVRDRQRGRHRRSSQVARLMPARSGSRGAPMPCGSLGRPAASARAGFPGRAASGCAGRSACRPKRRAARIRATPSRPAPCAAPRRLRRASAARSPATAASRSPGSNGRSRSRRRG